MAEVQYNINDLFGKTFGISGRFPLYTVDGSIMSEPTTGHKSKTGVYMWDRMVIDIPFIDDGIESLKANESTGVAVYLMPDTTLVHAQKTKDIVKTKVTGRDGTVKELISDGDWSVTFQGFIINDKEPGKYPEEKVKSTRDLYALKQSVRVHSKYLNNLGIFDIVIEGCDFPPLEGYADVQPFELTCVSDTPAIIEINNNARILDKLKNVSS